MLADVHVITVAIGTPMSAPKISTYTKPAPSVRNEPGTITTVQRIETSINAAEPRYIFSFIHAMNVVNRLRVVS